MSSDASQSLRLGISRPSLNWLKAIEGSAPDFIELSLAELQLEGAREIANWSRWFRRNPKCKPVLQIRIAGARSKSTERVREQQFALLEEIGTEWSESRILFSGASQGGDGAAEWMRGLEGRRYSLGWEHSKAVAESPVAATDFEVWDPFFHFADPSENRGFFPAISCIPATPMGQIRYWKIHGWLEERWMRFFSKEQIHSLRACAESSSRSRCETWISLAHSQREEQWSTFVAELRGAS